MRPVRSRFTLLVALCCFALGFSACSKPAPPNIVIVVLDTARPDALSVYGAAQPTSPFLEEFAKSGTTYERAYSSSSWTLPAHATLFTGALPTVHHATQSHPKLEASVPTLAERLTAAGYETAGFSNNPWVSATTDLSRGFARFVDKWEKRETRDDANPQAHPTVKAVEEWLGTQAKDAKPFFLFVNLIEPHMPYLPPPECAAPFIGDPKTLPALTERYFKRGEPNALLVRHYAGKEPLSDDDWATLRALYDGELRYVDSLTRAIVGAAEKRGGSDKTLVFLVSDHGENLGDHGHIGHTFNLYDSNVRIALLARGPSIGAGARERKLTQIADVYATSLAAAGLPRDKHCVGQDLRQPLSSARVLYAALDRPEISFGVFPKDVQESGVLKRFDRELEAVIGPRFKLIRASDGSEELFDLLADPNELHPLASAEEASSFVTSARGVISAVRAAGTSASGAATLSSDPKVLDALRSLGYAQ